MKELDDDDDDECCSSQRLNTIHLSQMRRQIAFLYQTFLFFGCFVRRRFCFHMTYLVVSLFEQMLLLLQFFPKLIKFMVRLELVPDFVLYFFERRSNCKTIFTVNVDANLLGPICVKTHSHISAVI